MCVLSIFYDPGTFCSVSDWIRARETKTKLSDSERSGEVTDFATTNAISLDYRT